MQKTCCNGWCNANFDVSDDDRLLMGKFNIHRDPEECPNCRNDHRRMFSPILNLHRRKSDLSGELLLSIFHPRHSFPVYAIKEWWSDQWDALSFGRAFDFQRPFFEQFTELYNSVPKMANHNENTENCEYSYSCGNAKNVYYSRTVHRSEDIYYSQYITGYNKSLCDCLVAQKSSFLYECILCFNCSNCTYLLKSSNCGDCHFSADLIGCQDCLFCHNLRNATFCIDNQPVSKEVYQRIKSELLNGQYGSLLNNMKHFREVYSDTIWKSLNNINSENCVGDTLINCSNCYQCFNCVNTHDARYCTRLTPSEQCISAMDVSSGGIGELLYNCVGLGGGNYFMRMCLNCRICSNLTYCADCYSTKNCFGCTGLKNKQYCILNVQYSQEEYTTLVSKIIEHLHSTGEWGDFFPISMSPFSYNEGGNTEEYTLSRDEVLRRGWSWHDEHAQEQSGLSVSTWPDGISDVDSSILHQAFSCSVTGKRYKIIPQELAFYRTMNLPIPREHPQIRMERRKAKLTPYRLCSRSCTRCGRSMDTTYSVERPELVYCEGCYMTTVYG